MIYELFPSDKYLPKPVDECLELYFSTTFYARTRQVLCMRFYFASEELLRSWADAFNLFLIGEGCPEKTLTDYTIHFPRWLKFQDLNSNPKYLFAPKQSQTQQNKPGVTQTNIDAAQQAIQNIMNRGK